MYENKLAQGAFINPSRIFTMFIMKLKALYAWLLCAEVLQPSQPNGVMSSAVSLPNHMLTGQA